MQGLASSLILHLFIMGLFVFGMPKFSKYKDHEDTTVVLDIVDVSEITNVKIKQAASKKNKNITKSEAPKSQSVEKKVKKEVEKPIKKAEEPKNKKVQDAEIIPDKKKKQAKESAVKKKVAHSEDAKRKKVKDDAFEKSILKSVEEVKSVKEKEKLDKDFADLSDALKGQSSKEYNSNIPMSISEIDAIKSQITRNWNTTAFAGADSRGMYVKVVIELDMQGNVTRLTPRKESSSSPYYAAFVDSALRAIKLASPLKKLNPEKYNQWRKIEFNFDSEGMVY